jgi:hypothetical protein
MAKRREPTGNAPVELKLDIPEVPTEVLPPEAPPDAPVPSEARYNPVPMEPGTPEAIVNNLMVREICDPTGPTEPISPTVNTLAQYVTGLTHGRDITPIKEEIKRIVQHQPEKADVFNALMNLIDQERVADMVEIRAGTEKILKRSVRRGDLTTGEALVLHRVSNNVIKEAMDRQTSANKGVDTVTIIQKVDYNQQTTERTIQQKWEGTSPQGREIIRKKIFELKKDVRQIIETTVTT